MMMMMMIKKTISVKCVNASVRSIWVLNDNSYKFMFQRWARTQKLDICPTLKLQNNSDRLKEKPAPCRTQPTDWRHAARAVTETCWANVWKTQLTLKLGNQWKVSEVCGCLLQSECSTVIYSSSYRMRKPQIFSSQWCILPLHWLKYYMQSVNENHIHYLYSRWSWNLFPIFI